MEHFTTTVPYSFYDEGYFTGVTSNYKGGYTQARFGELFAAMALCLTQSYPDAHTFLDLGCAKGLLVHALRVQGVVAHGIDCSAYAIAEAAPQVAPYLTCQPLEKAYFPQVDVAVALETLEHLTPAQLEETLGYLSTVTRSALIATLPMPDMRNRLAWQEAQAEVTHVTLQPRVWWHTLLRRCGWRIDAHTHLAERYFMNHPLFCAAGWCPLVAGVVL